MRVSPFDSMSNLFKPDWSESWSCAVSLLVLLSHHTLLSLPVNGQPRKSGLTVEFSDLGFRVQAPGNLTGEELDSALNCLLQRVESQELSALLQLQTIFNVLLQ